MNQFFAPMNCASAPVRDHWSPAWRAFIFVLAATSIWCLLAEMYGLCSMRTFTFFILIPATVMLYGLGFWDRISGNRELWRAVMIGTIAGFFAACAYDVFRLPFVFADAWHLTPVVPKMPLFKVFPAFGKMILHPGPLDPASYLLSDHLVGWLYHFSNGMTFGVMYVALLGDPRKHGWIWGVVMAVVIEICLLISRYGNFFDIPVTMRFVVVTLTAHVVFGAALGWLTLRMAKRFSFAPVAPA